MKGKLIACVAVCSMVAGIVSADTLRFHGSGSWDMLENVGQPEGWQSIDAPDATDTVRANWGGDVGNVVTLDYATTVNKFELGVGESGEFHILSGGSLTTLGDSRIGNNGDTATRIGTLTIDDGGTVTVGSWLGIGHGTPGFSTVSGTLNANSHLWMGATSDADSVGSLIINNGGVVNVAGNIGLGTINASTASGGSAMVTINNGGLLSLHHWGDTGSIQAGSVLTINGSGVVIVGGDRVDAANDYFTAGKIASDQGAILATFDGGANETTIIAIPEPATLGMLAVFGAGMIYVRRRFRI